MVASVQTIAAPPPQAYPCTLITGAAHGVGAATARLLAQHGHSLLLQYRHSRAKIELLQENCRQLGAAVEIIHGDFSTAEQTAQFLTRCEQQVPAPNQLVVAVGPYVLGKVSETSLNNWRDLFETNFFAPVQLIQALLPAIRNARGAIVTLGVAGVADMRAESYAGAYFTAKRALWSYTRSLAKEVAVDGVSVNMISPGRLQGAVDAPKEPSQLPMGREGTAEEVARVIAFLLQPENRYITGQQIEIAGGVRL